MFHAVTKTKQPESYRGTGENIMNRWVEIIHPTYVKINSINMPVRIDVQLLLKNFNTRADLLSQLRQSISLILSLYHVLLVLF